jgi:serine/threonine protein kinase
MMPLMIPQSHLIRCWHPACAERHYPQQTQFCGQCGAQLRLADRYQAIQLLGQGGSGRTWLATPSPLEAVVGDVEWVVVKQFSPTWLAQQADDRVGAALPLAMAATAAGQLPASLLVALHRWQQLDPRPQIPALLDYFEQAGYFYLMQTYIPGENLATMVAKGLPFSPIAISHLLASLLPVLQLMHSRGIIHRDIKPANIMRPALATASAATYALVDWSTATAWTDAIALPDQTTLTGQAVTTPGNGVAAIGSPEYTAPEQLRGGASPASDLYSLGVISIHLLTGMSPFALFDGLENRWLWRKFWLPESAPALSNTRLAVLFNLLDRLIAPDPTQRCASAAEAIAALQTGQPPIVNVAPPPAPTWQAIYTLQGHQGLFAKVNAVAASPSWLASASDDRTIRLWDRATGQATAVLTGHGHFVQAVAFHPHDGNSLVSGSRDGTLKRWHCLERRPTHTLIGHTQTVLAVGFTPDGRQIVSGGADKTLKLWDSQTGELMRTLTGHRLAVRAIAMIAGQRPLIASASADATLKLWDLGTGELVQTLTGHTAAIWAIALSPDGTWLASGGEDRTIRLWNLTTQQTRCLAGHSWPVAALQFMPDSATLVSGSWDHSLKLWCVSTGQVQSQLTGHTDSVSSIALAAADHPAACYLISGSHDTTLKVWRREC